MARSLRREVLTFLFEEVSAIETKIQLVKTGEIRTENCKVGGPMLEKIPSIDY